MPYIRLSTNKVITTEMAVLLKTELARAVETVPGKSEATLMIELCGEQVMFYRGAEGDFAFIDARFSGAVVFEDKKRFTEAALCRVEEVLGLERGNANLTFTAYSDWGTKGTLFSR